jgi:hypothetical protein
MSKLALPAMALACCVAAGRVCADTHIVRNGRPEATIIVAEDPPRMTALAVLELQYYLEKISGARLPIAHKPQDGLPVKIYVGKSRFAHSQGVSDEVLQYGAFRMASGDDWLVLLGHDRDYSPPAPARRSKWRWNPRGAFDRLMSERYGEDNRHIFNPRNLNASDLGFWLYDAGGSLNAVCRYLMSLGVRWYMPGRLGEVIPDLKTIPLPSVDATVHPDYALRTFNWSGYVNQSFEDMIWGRRMGMTSVYEVLGPFTWAHNLPKVYNRPEIKKAHPEYFALRGGARDTKHRKVGSACFSSEGLVQETVNYARSLFDRSEAPAIDLWPEDGYRHCHCDSCAAKPPSEAVRGFVDKVARQLYETHPDRLVTCGAYTPYTDPPATIAKFTPNVGVMIANVRRPILDNDEHWAWYWGERVRGWREKIAPGNILRWENVFPRRPFPVIHPRAIARELKALKGISQGEFTNCQPGPRFESLGAFHLTLYTITQFLWDADQDVEALLEEYYALFYGPAREEMKAALEYAQASYSRVDRKKRQGLPWAVDMSVQIRFLEMLHTARERSGDNIYGERIQMMIDEMPPLKQLREKARQEADAPDPREDAPLLIGSAGPGPKNAPIYRMKTLIDGEAPKVETTFRIWWEKKALCFELRCEEPDMGNLVSSNMVYDGDSVVMLIETPALSYYHIEISPEGKVFERAVNPLPGMDDWSAQAEVKTERGADYWRVRARLPVSGEDGLAKDPRHLIAGAKPVEARPWHINVGRSRVRGKSEHFAFSPTGKGSYHVPAKFARLVIR